MLSHAHACTDLSVLGNLPDLVYLDVSYNKLTSILDFQPPPRNLLVRRVGGKVGVQGGWVGVCGWVGWCVCRVGRWV